MLEVRYVQEWKKKKEESGQFRKEGSGITRYWE